MPEERRKLTTKTVEIPVPCFGTGRQHRYSCIVERKTQVEHTPNVVPKHAPLVKLWATVIQIYRKAFTGSQFQNDRKPHVDFQWKQTIDIGALVSYFELDDLCCTKGFFRVNDDN